MNGIFNSEVASSAFIDPSALILNSRVGDTCQVFDDAMLCYAELGDFSYISRRTCVFSSVIGKYCSISWNASIGPGNHDYQRISQHAMLYTQRFGMITTDRERYYNQYDGEASIGNDVWIGCNATIMRGVSIGNGAVIGAGAVITRDVAPYTIMGGVNKFLKIRFEENIAERLEQLKWWDYPIAAVKECLPLLACRPTLESLDLLEERLQQASKNMSTVP